jgi:hypothetical protein
MIIFPFVVPLIAVAMLAGMGTATACDCLVRDSGGRLVVRIEKDGVFREASGRRIGIFNAADGAVRSASGRLIGRIDVEGAVRDGSGRRLGTVGNNGTLRDASGRILGRIDGGSALRTSTGRLVGRLEGWDSDCVYPVTAHLMFFDPPLIVGSAG